MEKNKIFNIMYGKEKKEIYDEFKIIEKSIETSNDLYQYFDEFKNMLVNDKAYIKTRAFRIICKMSYWDKDNKIDNNILKLLNVLDNNKPTNIRQCLIALQTLIKNKPELLTIIKEHVQKINYSRFKDTMSTLIKKDVDKLLNNIKLLS